MHDAAITLKSVTRLFGTGDGRFAALREVDLEIPRGEHAALVGPSGSGKTTLLNLIGALDRADSGTVSCLGFDLGGISERAAADYRRRHVGLVFQDDALMPELTVRENVELPLILLHVYRAARRQQVSAILDVLGLSHRADAFPSTLSGGEKQRVAVARAVVHRPQLLLADEPTANLDTDSAMRVLDAISAVASQNCLTVVLATHDTRVIEHFPRIVTLKDGRIMAD
jgi:putative ABC transport system ATP-binding protein